MYQHDVVRHAARTGAALVLLASPTVWAPAMAESDPPPRSLPGPALVETTDPAPVELRVGPHRFRIPRSYFRHPPPPSGVGTGFYLRALLPGMEPITEANRRVFRMPLSTEEGRRVVGLVFLVMPDRPRDDARWRMDNRLRRRGGATLDDFEPASGATHGLRGPPIGDAGWRENDLYWGELPGGRFVGLSCFSRPDDRPTDCKLNVDWRGRTVDVSHERRPLPRWREIAEAALALMDRLSVGDEGGSNAAER